MTEELQLTKAYELDPSAEENPRKREVGRLDDLRAYWCKLNSEETDIADLSEEEERDDDLKRKIEQYNRSNRNNKDKERDRERRNRRGQGEREGSRKRKIRTTITQQKLDEMNRIFS